MIILIPLIIFCIAIILSNNDNTEGVGVAISIISGIFLFIATISGSISYTEHAYDLGGISEYSRIVSVHETNVEQLTKRLNAIESKQGTILNADKPIAALTEAIATAMNNLAEARSDLAMSYVRISRRSKGFFGFIVSNEDLILLTKEAGNK